MLFFSGAFIYLSFLIFVAIIPVNAIASPRTPFGRYPTATPTIWQAYNNSLNISVRTSPSERPTGARNKSITAAPTEYPQSCPGCCLVGHPLSCDGKTTWDGPPITSLDAQCILWNSSCKGDKDAAAQMFFDNVVMLDEKPCWRGSGNASYRCTDYEPAETLSAMSRIKDWMRGPECMPMSAKKVGPTTRAVTNAGTTAIITASMTINPGESCCGLPIIEAQNVDVYYWPEPGANTACLSIVGDSVRPLYYDATTGSGSEPPYWGCTAKHPETTTSTSLLDAVGTDVSWTIVTSVQSIITTAHITSVNSLTFRCPLINPWSPPDCLGVTSPVRSSNGSAQVGGASKSIQARGHSLVIPTSVIQDGLPVSTVISGEFTFTSPSIYANFHSITAADWCGPLGSELRVTQTMLSFAPGELSTIAGPLYNPVGTLYTTYSTKVFDFADLPCPPQNVMEENWYIPAPGEPYRPLIALPEKVKKIDPAWSGCSDAFFTGVDPPKTLAPAGAMVPDVTSSHSIAIPSTPEPSPTPNTGPKETALGIKIETTPVLSSVEAQASKSLNSIPDKPGETAGFHPQVGSKEEEGKPAIVTSDPNQQTGNGGKLQPVSQSDVRPGIDTGLIPLSRESRPDLFPEPTSQSHPTVTLNQDSPIHQSGSGPDNQQTRGGSKPLGAGLAQQNTQPQQPNPPSTVTQQDESRLDPSGPYFPVVGNSIVIRPSSPISEDANRGQDGNPSNAAGAAYSSQSNKPKGGEQLVHIPAAADIKATTIAEYAMKAVTNGVSIGDTLITAGAAPVTVSGTQISVDDSKQVYVEGTPYQLPTPSPAPAITLGNSAVAVPVQAGISIYGMTLEAGAPAITASGVAISLDGSNNLVLAGAAESYLQPLAPDASGASSPEEGKQLVKSGQVMAAASTAIKAVGTLSPEASALTVNGMAVSLDSAGNVVAGSRTFAVKGASRIAVSLNSAGEIVAGSQTVAAKVSSGIVGSLDSAGAIVMGSKTLTVEGASGMAVSLNSAGEMVVGSKTLIVEGATGIAMSLDSVGDIVVGSQTIAVEGTSRDLGDLIMGGFQAGGPHATDPTSPAQAKPLPAASTNASPASTSTAPAHSPSVPSTNVSPGASSTSRSKAKGMRSLLQWKVVATFVVMTIVCLYK